MALLLLIWSEVYLVYRLAPSGLTFAKLSPLQIIRGPIVFHFWFFYSLIGLYLFMPLLQAFYRGVPETVLAFALTIAAFAIGVLPIVDYSVGRPLVGVDLTYFHGYAMYAVVGAVLFRKGTYPWHIGCGLALWGLGSAAVAIGTQVLTMRAGTPVGLLFNYTCIFVAVSAAGLFIAVRRCGSELPQSLARLVKAAAPASIGIYILHVMFLPQLPRLGSLGLENPWTSVPAGALLIWTASLGLALALRAIPKVGRIILP